MFHEDTCSRKEQHCINDSPNKYPEADIILMGELLIDNINVEFCGHVHVYQQTVGIPMGTNWWQICFIIFIHMKLILYNIYKRVSSRRKTI